MDCEQGDRNAQGAGRGSRTRLLVCLAVGACAAWPADALALDVQVSSTTSAQVYEVRGASAGLFLKRRRVTERLTLRLANILPRETEPGYDGPRISVALVLRLDSDFGAERLESRASSDLYFIPGLDPHALDILVAGVLVEDLFARTTSVRAGRLLTFDATGFSALDGLEARVRLPWHVELRVASGVEVVAGQRLSSGAFEVDGVVRVRRDDIDEGTRSEVQEPLTRVVLAGGASLTGYDWLTADLAFRQGFVPGDQARTSFQRLAGSVGFDAGIVQGGALASGDLALGLVDEISAELAVRPLRWLLVGVGGRYDAPVFDTDSIFAAFWADPAVQGQLRLQVTPMPGLQFGALGLVRRLGLLVGNENDAPDADALRGGGEAYARLRLGRYSGDLRAKLADGHGGRRAGLAARFGALLPGDRVSVDLRGTLLGLRDDLAPNEHRVVLGYVVGARYAMSREASLLFELEHNHSRALGHGLRFLAMLDLGFWI